MDSVLWCDPSILGNAAGGGHYINEKLLYNTKEFSIYKPMSFPL